MTVDVIFRCSGCDATARGTAPLRREFRSLSGRTYGFGYPVAANNVEDVVPEGWVAYDPWTYCTYCPDCYAYVVGEDAEREAATEEKHATPSDP